MRDLKPTPGVRSSRGRQHKYGVIGELIIAQSTTAGTLDLRSEVGDLETSELAFQAGWLLDLPYGMRHLAMPRLPAIMAELNQRAAAALEEARQ